MNAEELDQLFEKYLEGKCTPEETLLVEQLVDNYDNKSTAWEDLDDHKQQAWLQTLWAEIKTTMLTYESRYLKFRKFKLWSRIAAAAVVLLVISAGLFFYNHYTNTLRHPELVSGPPAYANDIKPGSNKAYLILSNGKRLSLTDAANGAIAKETGVEITKTADGQVVYAPHNNNGDISGRHPEFSSGPPLNTIETPKGGQYQIRLPDGSKVWLNAASKLIYPVTFTGRGYREVELYGEAYFEIFKNKLQPFVVKSKNQEVTVLGTHFNVNSYTDEPNTKTTLLEGSVRINGVILKPGEQATLQANKINVKEVDPALVIDWKNGQFIFESEPLPSILRKVARWYNVSIIYTNTDKNNTTFSGVVSRADNVSSVLRMLQKTSRIKFTIEGNTVKVE